jgi:hypothetical protein
MVDLYAHAFLSGCDSELARYSVRFQECLSRRCSSQWDQLPSVGLFVVPPSPVLRYLFLYSFSQICVHMDIFHCRNLFPPIPSPHLVQAFDFVHWCSRHLAICNVALLGRWCGRHQRLCPRGDQSWELRGYCALPSVEAAVRCSCYGKVDANVVFPWISLF